MVTEGKELSLPRDKRVLSVSSSVSMSNMTLMLHMIKHLWVKISLLMEKFQKS
jgi:hypothetical protein